ncbi:hypothetical protein P3G55_27210 [Leptospira sp. 96542]|nr:hypothetical protein [Leptospira sp. 96542]
MANTLNGKLVVAISSRALFDFEEENALFELDVGVGMQRYCVPICWWSPRRRGEAGAK